MNKAAVLNVFPGARAFRDRANGGRWYVTAPGNSSALGAGITAAAAWKHARQRLSNA